ncbi:PRD domain-containing protein [Lacticaseibacillus daqingensis]|uniref:PRD domain-containing protein n=1 Tax=Lacticaseibacillus daqingensis TaxID=2486014 RepID=UPI000F7B06EE|nr:PRD domain-containing protein [Lacticaseibacillus daqingensis]
MKILQVLNNNVLLVEDGDDKQQIIWGKGIGFKSTAGTDYVPQPEDHIFLPVSHDEEWVDSFKELASEIPRSYFELTDMLVGIARQNIQKDFDGHLLVPLTDHIYFAVQRMQNGVLLRNPMLFDIQRFFPKEYEVGKRALGMIERLSGVTPPDDEAAFIAMHLIEHELNGADTAVHSVADCLEILAGVNQIMAEDFGNRFSESSVATSRMATHLYYLLLSTQAEHRRRGQAKADRQLLRQMSAQYPDARKTLERIVAYLEQHISYQFNDSDRLFLIIHIIHIID